MTQALSLFEITTGHYGESCQRAYAWAESSESAIKMFVATQSEEIWRWVGDRNYEKVSQEQAQ